jgi:hypothetical protein
MKRVLYSELLYDEGDGRYYCDGAPFSGISFTLYQDGTLASESGMREGIECGKARAWFQSGSLELEREIECGVRLVGAASGIRTVPWPSMSDGRWVSVCPGADQWPMEPSLRTGS